MNNIIKISIFTAVVAVVFGVFAFTPAKDMVKDTVLSPATVFAWGDSGCSGCGGNSTGDSGSGENPRPGVCTSFTASPTTLPYGGGDVTLSWSTANAYQATISNIGYVPTHGSTVVHVTNTTTFTLTPISSDSGNSTCTATVVVQSAPPPPPPPSPVATCDSFTASPTTLPYGGGNVTLTWNTTNASSVSIDNGIGGVSVDGSTVVHVSNTANFNLTAAGAGGNASCAVHITVQPEVVKAATCDSFTASPTTLPYGGGNVTLTWNTTNASSVSINNNIGTVSADGSTSVNVSGNTTFVLTAIGAAGNASCQANVTVGSQEIVPKCDFLDVSDSSVEEGDSVTLSWGTTNATNVYINEGIGNVSVDGSTSVRVYDDTTYILTATRNGANAACQVDVNVDDNNDDDTPSPTCDLNISDDQVNRGDTVTLSWDTSRADDIVIKDDNRNTIFDTDDYSSSKRRNYYDGEVDVVVNEDTKFTLTARGDGGTRTCKVNVEVKDDNVVVYEKRDQPLVVSLTQVPYTGFEAGPALTFIFYGLLTLWAMFIAYILVIKKGSIMGFSLAGNVSASALADEENKKKVQALMEKYAHKS